jgi:predicted nucleotidyltransferase component of viral defense system
MSKKDFDDLVEKVIKQRASLSAMRPVVEKEILHYDIFKALSSEGLLDLLTFQGGTSLRLCRGANRFSEDLDFVGGRDFNFASMSKIKQCIEEHIGERYGLTVRVKEPKERSVDGSGETVRVDRWMVTVQSSPEKSDLPSQKIKVEIANTVAYTKEPVALKINYDFLDYPDQIIIPTESLSEVLADKIVAFPRSLYDRHGADAKSDSTLIRHRDIWDISWLLRNGAELNPQFVNAKINDDYGVSDFGELLKNAELRLPLIVGSKEFMGQMTRFIDVDTLKDTIQKPSFVNQMQADVISMLAGMAPQLVAKDETARKRKSLPTLAPPGLSR